ncbi:MAG: ATP-binding protein [Microthrixaceae bacterium]|nr:ATP-binding protein [Microthrixaceae bacterium]
MTARTIELKVPPDSRYLAAARNFVADAARDGGWTDEDQLDDLRLVVSESVTNALKALLAQQSVEPIRLVATVSDQSIEVLVSDSAGGFRPDAENLTLPEPDLSREGGFGVPLIQAYSDEASYTSVGGGTEVRIVVNRSRGDSED